MQHELESCIHFFRAFYILKDDHRLNLHLNLRLNLRLKLRLNSRLNLCLNPVKTAHLNLQFCSFCYKI